MVFSQYLFKTSYFIAILTRNRKNSSRTSKTIKLTQRQRSEPAQRYLAFTLIPSSQIFPILHFTGTLHFVSWLSCHGLYHQRRIAEEGDITPSTKTQTLLRMTNLNLVVISDLGWVLAESNYLPSYVFLVVDNDLTISPSLMMHLIRLSYPCCQPYDPMCRAWGRVLVKRGNCY